MTDYLRRVTGARKAEVAYKRCVIRLDDKLKMRPVGVPTPHEVETFIRAFDNRDYPLLER